MLDRTTWPRAGAIAARAVTPALAVAVGIASASGRPNPGASALSARLADAIVEHGVPLGSASLGWLGALVVKAFAEFGTAAVAVASGIAAALAILCVGYRAVRRDAGVAAGLAAPLATLCLLDALQTGGDVVAWCGAACAALLLEFPTRRSAVAYAALTIVWCNVEAAGIIAPMLAVAALVGMLLDVPRDPERSLDRARRARVVTAVGAVVGVFCTPAGLAFPAAAFDALRLSDATHGIVATAPAITAPHAYHLGLFFIVALALAAGARERGLRDAVPIVATFVLALANGAFVPIFGIVAAPVVVGGLRSLRSCGIAVPIVACAAVVAIASGFRDRTADSDGPFALAVRAARESGTVRTLFCAKIDWCDVAVASGEPVVMDGAIESYGDDARADQRALAGAGPEFASALAHSHATAILAANDTPLATLVALMPAWKIEASDTRATLFERRSP